MGLQAVSERVVAPAIDASSSARSTTDRVGPSRCFPFWQELLACYVVNTDTDDMSGGKKCLPVLEDYYECLHHKKEVRPCLVVGQDKFG